MPFLPGMRLDWLDDLLAVHEAGALARAAARRHVSASAFTRRLRMIEAALGVPLLDRRRKPVRLRAEVATRVDEMRRAAAALRQLRGGLVQGGGLQGVTLVCQHALTVTHSAALVARLGAGGRPVRVRSENREECLLRLLSAEAGLALVYAVPGLAPPTLPTGFARALLGTERLIAVAAPGLAQGLARDDGDAGLPLIAYPSEVFLGQVTERAVLPSLPPCCPPVPRVETALTLAARDYARQGLGVAWLPEGMVRADLDAGTLCRPSGWLAGRLPEVPMQIVLLRLEPAADAALAADWAALTEGAAPVG